MDVIAGVLVAAGLSLASTASQAIPEYVAAVSAAWQVNYVGCGTCHYDGFQGGTVIGYGVTFGAVPTHQTDPQGAALIAGRPPGCCTTTIPPTTTTTGTTTSTTVPSGSTTTGSTTTSTWVHTTRVPTSTSIPPNSTTVIGPTTTSASSPTTTSTSSTTTTTRAVGGAALYGSYCASCHDGAAAAGGGRNVLGARTCSIDGALNGTKVFRGGVPAMQFLKGMLSAAQIRSISDYLNSGPVTGQQRYITACAGCHGADARGGRVGEGVRGSNPGEIRGAIREGEGGMGVVKCLPATDINEISSYLRGKFATTRPSTTTPSPTTTTHRRHSLGSAE